MDPTLQAMLAGNRGGMGGGSGDEFFNKWLCFLLPQLQLDNVPISFETAAPFAFLQRNIFPMASNMSMGNPNGILAKLLRACQANSIREVQMASIEDMKQMMGEGNVPDLGHDANFNSAIMAASAGAAVAAQSAAMMDGGQGIG